MTSVDLLEKLEIISLDNFGAIISFKFQIRTNQFGDNIFYFIWDQNK